MPSYGNHIALYPVPAGQEIYQEKKEKQKIPDTEWQIMPIPHPVFQMVIDKKPVLPAITAQHFHSEQMFLSDLFICEIGI